MLRRTTFLLPRSHFAALAVVLGLQFAATGFAPSHASSQGTRFAHGTAATLSLPVATAALEFENGEAGSGSTASASHTTLRPRPTSDGTCADAFTPWRVDDALARAGRLSSPSTAPPLSGA